MILSAFQRLAYNFSSIIFTSRILARTKNQSVNDDRRLNSKSLHCFFYQVILYLDLAHHVYKVPSSFILLFEPTLIIVKIICYQLGYKDKVIDILFMSS
jgi:hypothetical protein